MDMTKDKERLIRYNEDIETLIEIKDKYSLFAPYIDIEGIKKEIQILAGHRCTGCDVILELEYALEEDMCKKCIDEEIINETAFRAEITGSWNER